MPLDSHHIVLQSLGWIRLTIEPACFCAEPLCDQSVIVHQQNVCRHFVACKAQASGLPPALEKSHTLLHVNRGILGHKDMTLVLKVIIFEIKVGTACWSVGCPLCRCRVLNVWKLLP